MTKWMTWIWTSVNRKFLPPIKNFVNVDDDIQVYETPTHEEIFLSEHGADEDLILMMVMMTMKIVSIWNFRESVSKILNNWIVFIIKW